MLGEEVERSNGDVRQLHFAGVDGPRLLTHDAYHCGELSQTSGSPACRRWIFWRPD